MKKKLFIYAIIVLAVGLAYYAVFKNTMGGTYISTDFATKVSLRGYRNKKQVRAVVTDADDIKTLKRMFSGWAYDSAFEEFPYECVDDVAVILSGGKKSIAFLPVVNGDAPLVHPVVESDKGNRYIYIHLSRRQRNTMYNIGKKYGVTLRY